MSVPRGTLFLWFSGSVGRELQGEAFVLQGRALPLLLQGKALPSAVQRKG